MVDFIDNIELSDKAMSEITLYSNFGPDWVKRATRTARARIYIDKKLELKHSTNERHLGKYCASGTLTYARKDGDDITEEDIIALLCINRGQENYVRERGHKQVTIYWLCDSSD